MQRWAMSGRRAGTQCGILLAFQLYNIWLQGNDCVLNAFEKIRVEVELNKIAVIHPPRASQEEKVAVYSPS